MFSGRKKTSKSPKRTSKEPPKEKTRSLAKFTRSVINRMRGSNTGPKFQTPQKLPNNLIKIDLKLNVNTSLSDLNFINNILRPYGFGLTKIPNEKNKFKIHIVNKDALDLIIKQKTTLPNINIGQKLEIGNLDNFKVKHNEGRKVLYINKDEINNYLLETYSKKKSISPVIRYSKPPGLNQTGLNHDKKESSKRRTSSSSLERLSFGSDSDKTKKKDKGKDKKKTTTQPTTTQPTTSFTTTTNTSANQPNTSSFHIAQAQTQSRSRSNSGSKTKKPTNTTPKKGRFRRFIGGISNVVINTLKRSKKTKKSSPQISRSSPVPARPLAPSAPELPKRKGKGKGKRKRRTSRTRRRSVSSETRELEKELKKLEKEEMKRKIAELRKNI